MAHQIASSIHHWVYENSKGEHLMGRKQYSDDLLGSRKHEILLTHGGEIDIAEWEQHNKAIRQECMKEPGGRRKGKSYMDKWLRMAQEKPGRWVRLDREWEVTADKRGTLRSSASSCASAIRRGTMSGAFKGVKGFTAKVMFVVGKNDRHTVIVLWPGDK